MALVMAVLSLRLAMRWDSGFKSSPRARAAIIGRGRRRRHPMGRSMTTDVTTDVVFRKLPGDATDEGANGTYAYCVA
jgi:hypothetical protein